ncbi:MAG: NfeD family protein [Planctomycetota bacterium]
MGTEYTVYLICAVAGCSLVVLQLVLQLFGFLGDVDMDSGDHDMDFDTDAGDGADGHGNLFFGILSFKAISAFVGVFGLVGCIMLDSEMGFGARTLISFGSGVIAMFVVAQMMLWLVRLQASGSVDLRNAIGATATVYLRIPEKGEGRGKVTVKVQGRSMECAAMSNGPAIPTGGLVKVVSVEGTVLRVSPA